MMMIEPWHSIAIRIAASCLSRSTWYLEHAPKSTMSTVQLCLDLLLLLLLLPSPISYFLPPASCLLPVPSYPTSCLFHLNSQSIEVHTSRTNYRTMASSLLHNSSSYLFHNPLPERQSLHHDRSLRHRLEWQCLRCRSSWFELVSRPAWSKWSGAIEQCVPIAVSKASWQFESTDQSMAFCLLEVVGSVKRIKPDIQKERGPVSAP